MEDGRHTIVAVCITGVLAEDARNRGKYKRSLVLLEPQRETVDAARYRNGSPGVAPSHRVKNAQSSSPICRAVLRMRRL